LKISVVTPVYNCEATLKQCIESVLDQAYANFEFLIVDGESSDATVSIIEEFQDRIRWISEKDQGIFDAFNKGISMATGDVVCFLGADDMYVSYSVLEAVSVAFESNPESEIVYGDIIYVSRNDTTKIERFWKSRSFEPGLYRKGWTPPNTAFFVKREVFKKYGMFDLQYRLAADFDLHYRLLEKFRLKSLYLPGTMVKMRSGGVSNSSLRNMFNSLKECYYILKSHRVKYPLICILSTLIFRVNQLFATSDSFISPSTSPERDV
jgi:glycosyltransferase